MPTVSRAAGRRRPDRDGRITAAVADIELFDAFAAVPHGWLPPWQPWRSWTAGLGLLLRRRSH